MLGVWQQTDALSRLSTNISIASRLLFFAGSHLLDEPSRTPTTAAPNPYSCIRIAYDKREGDHDGQDSGVRDLR
jgi:hypothetical protein